MALSDWVNEKLFPGRNEAITALNAAVEKDDLDSIVEKAKHLSGDFYQSSKTGEALVNAVPKVEDRLGPVAARKYVTELVDWVSPPVMLGLVSNLKDPPPKNDCPKI